MSWSHVVDFYMLTKLLAEGRFKAGIEEAWIWTDPADALYAWFATYLIATVVQVSETYPTQ